MHGNASLLKGTESCVLVCLGCGITALLRETSLIKKMTVMVSEGGVRQEPEQKQAQSVAQIWYTPSLSQFLQSFRLDKC